jgi:hypothetical protein
MASLPIVTPVLKPSFFIDSVKLVVRKMDAEELAGRVSLHLLKSQAGISVPRGVLEEVLLCSHLHPHVVLLQHAHEAVCAGCTGT